LLDITKTFETEDVGVAGKWE